MDKKSEVISVLESLAKLSKIKKENRFKEKALSNAARIIDSLDDFLDLYSLGTLKDISGIGSKSLSIIDEIMKGKSYEDFLPNMPKELLDIALMPNVGLKRAKILYENLNIRSKKDLEEAILKDELLNISGIGKKIQDRIKNAINESRLNYGKLRLDRALILSEKIITKLKKNNKVKDAFIVGELRRHAEVIDAIEIIVIGDKLTFLDLENMLKALGIKEIKKIKEPFLGREGFNYQGLLIKVYRVPKKYKGIAKILLTGSDEFIKDLVAQTKKSKKDLKAIIGDTEEDVFLKLNLFFPPPEMRNKKASLIFKKKKIKKLIELKDLKGTFHNHTSSSDGRHTIKQMRKAAIDFGLSYISINDHSKTAFYAKGQSEQDLLSQLKAIKEINQDDLANKCFLFNGVESDILSDGSLDYDDYVLKKLEIIIASIHSKLKMQKEDMTKRMIKAASNPFTTIIGHPTNRLILLRSPSVYDFEPFFVACKNNKVAVELNSHPARLDLNYDHLPIAKEYGLLIAINTDAHNKNSFHFLEYGIMMARRAGLTANDVLNTMPIKDLRKYLKSR